MFLSKKKKNPPTVHSLATETHSHTHTAYTNIISELFTEKMIHIINCRDEGELSFCQRPNWWLVLCPEVF